MYHMLRFSEFEIFNISTKNVWDLKNDPTDCFVAWLALQTTEEAEFKRKAKRRDIGKNPSTDWL